MPFYPLKVRSYGIFVCTDEEFAPPSGYEAVFMRDRPYFAPQGDSAILASFDALQYRFDELKSDELELGYECQSGAVGKIRKFNSTLNSAYKSVLTSFA